jgi:acyl-CoA synthetase (AMP-forming)/AMP-acid ligase II
MSTALDDYRPAFQDSSVPFLTYHAINDDKTVTATTYTRGEFWGMGAKAASALTRNGVKKGDCYAQYFTDNRLEDVAFRLGAIMIGATPVTINWQGDTIDKVIYKIELTHSNVLLVDQGTPKEEIEAVLLAIPALKIVDVSKLDSEQELSSDQFATGVSVDQANVIIFTSGTTGNPKGVELAYTCYRANRGTFESFLEIEDQDMLFIPVIINPLHHTNSTAFADMAMRRPRTQMHLVQRYSTSYWRLLSEVHVANPGGRLICPAVSRHFDFLANLIETSTLPLPYTELKSALQRLDFLIGSAPVGPTTVSRLLEYAGKLPLVRFGSTETCLQVLGTPRHHSDDVRLGIFKQGWTHTYAGSEQPGYFIGRPHPPYNAVRVVESLERGATGYMVECASGQPGLIITKGGNVMNRYVGNAEATAKALIDGWYTNLGDVGFFLNDETEVGERNYFWQTRDSALLIRGGANYAYEQIENELSAFVKKTYDLGDSDFELAVCGVKVQSEHEDDCCVCLDLKTDKAKAMSEAVATGFIQAAQKVVSKGAKPNYLMLTTVPKNFKGAVLVKDLKPMFAAHLGLTAKAV